MIKTGAAWINYNNPLLTPGSKYFPKCKDGEYCYKSFYKHKWQYLAYTFIFYSRQFFIPAYMQGANVNE